MEQGQFQQFPRPLKSANLSFIDGAMPTPDASGVRAAAGLEWIGAYTWANRPAAASNSGKTITVTDVGESGSEWKSDGAYWRALNGAVTVAATATAVSAPADTAENILATVTIPAGLLGLDGQVFVDVTWRFTNNGNAKTIRVRYSGASGTEFISFNASNRGGILLSACGFANRGVTNAQVGLRDAALGNNAAPATSTVDTTAATTLVVSVQKATGSDTAAIDRLTVEVKFP